MLWIPPQYSEDVLAAKAIKPPFAGKPQAAYVICTFIKVRQSLDRIRVRASTHIVILFKEIRVRRRQLAHRLLFHLAQELEEIPNIVRRHSIKRPWTVVVNVPE